MNMRRTLMGYVPACSPAYALHPFTRLFSISLLTCIPLFIFNIRCSAALILTGFVLLIISRVDLRVLRLYIPIFSLLALFIFMVYTFFPEEGMKDEPLASLWRITLYRHAILYALDVYLRIVSILVLTICFLHVMTESELIVALRSIRIPFIICYLLGLALRTIGMFLEDFIIIRQAEQARALDLGEMSIFRKAGRLFAYVIPLLAIALRRAGEFSDAISSRGFSIQAAKKRPDYLALRYRFTLADAASMFVVTTITAAVFFYRYKILWAQ